MGQVAEVDLGDGGIDHADAPRQILQGSLEGAAIELQRMATAAP